MKANESQRRKTQQGDLLSINTAFQGVEGTWLDMRSIRGGEIMKKKGNWNTSMVIKNLYIEQFVHLILNEPV